MFIKLLLLIAGVIVVTGFLKDTIQFFLGFGLLAIVVVVFLSMSGIEVNLNVIVNQVLNFTKDFLSAVKPIIDSILAAV